MDDQPEDAFTITSEHRKAPGRISAAPDQVLSRAGNPSDPMTMITAARELLHEAWGPNLPTDTASLAESAQSSSSTGTVYQVSSPIGDLNGDGLADLLTVEVDLLSYSARLIGTRGTDGSDIWTVDASDDVAAFPLPVGDLDGDGSDDLLVLRLQIEGLGVGRCAEVACAVGLNYEYVWSVEARSGKDGTVRWQRDYEGEITEGSMSAGGLAAFAFADAFTATNLLVIPAPAGDLGGDGHPDVVINALDVTGVFGVGFAGFLAYGFT